MPTNLAEGSGRAGSRERRYFYNVAKGSAYEVVSLLTIAKKRRHTLLTLRRKRIWFQGLQHAKRSA
ncbi:MAG: four helix bundle protein [Anaerolineae bacterium]